MNLECFRPGYLHLLENGELERRVSESYAHLTACDCCAWNCRVNRKSGKVGICRSGEYARISSYGPHHGEEAPLRGWRGSGTVFFTSCNLRCQFCQNFTISQTSEGVEHKPAELATIMLALQAAGCHNINLVSPSHVVPQILAAVYIAAQAGLYLPLVYNTGGYDSLQALQWLDGVIDIYMPDMKYASNQVARYYSKIPHYVEVNRAAIREMFRQVGDLQIDQDGLAIRGLLVRHLVLPNNLAGTESIARFLAEEISTNTYFNLMSQYRPAFNARLFPRINHPITHREYQLAFESVIQAGITRLDGMLNE